MTEEEFQLLIAAVVLELSSAWQPRGLIESVTRQHAESRTARRAVAGPKGDPGSPGLKGAKGDRAGDRYITDAAKRLERRRGVDQVFRLHTAGDEFSILVLGDSAMNAGRLADLLVGDLKATAISASIGAACTASVDHKTRASLYGEAERAMQAAKQSKCCAVSTIVE